MGAITSNLPYILIGVALLILIAFIAYTMTRPEEDEYEDDDEVAGGSTLKMSGSHAADTMELPETDDTRARKSRMIALKDSLEKSLQTRAGVKASGMDRLAMPWFMLVGTEGSGKRSLLASTGLPLPYGPPVEVDSAKKDAGRWWLFEDAVVVEAPTAKPIPKSSAPSEITAAEPAVHLDTSEGWNNLLHLLRRERPDSPLNGIIVAVSCADLVGTRRKTPEEITEQAELVRAFLDKTRRVLGVRLPVHLLVTKCDVLPGFRSFAETLPDARRDDIFGWSNPNPLERAFNPLWVNNGFLEVQHALESLHDELLAAPEVIQDADGLFVFVNEFAELQDPLVDFASKLMPPGERRPSLFLRGMYFTGDASEMAAKAASRVDEDATTLHISIEATEAESHSLVFLRSLFADKIFREAGLARTAARLRISRDTRVILAQAAAVIITLLGGLGLWTAINGMRLGGSVNAESARSGDGAPREGLRTEAANLTRSLSGVAIDMDELRRGSQPADGDSAMALMARDAAVISLVSAMQTVSPGRVRSAFVPSSWLSPLPSQIESSLKEGIENLLLPVTRQRLLSRAELLFGAPAKTATTYDDLDPTDPASLTRYLSDVRELNRNVARYNRLASPDSGTAAELSAVLEYLFGETPIDSAAASEDFQEALRLGRAAPIAVTAEQSAMVVTRAASFVGSIADSASRQLSPRTAASSAEDDLRALRHLNALSLLLDPKKGLVASVSDSTPVGLRVARAVQDSIARRLGLAAARIVKDSLPPDQAGQRLRSVLAALFELRLMEASDGREIESELRPGQKLRWDVGQLELAFALRGELRRALITASDAFAPQTQVRLRSAFETQMRGRVLDLAASAQRFSVDTVRRMIDIRSESENLDGASTRLIRIARLLDTLKASSEGRKLIAAGARQAEHVLAMAQQILDSANYVAPHPTVVVSWRGGVPIGFAAMGVADTGSFTLALDREQLPATLALARAVAPALAYLRSSAVPSSMIFSPKLVNDWSAIAAATAKVDLQEPGNSVYALREFIARDMGALDVPACQAAAARSEASRGAVDWFTDRRRLFRAALTGRCGVTGGADAVAAYEKMRAVFVSKLAGKFPFVDAAKAAEAPDADPAAVREFYGLYDAFAKGGGIALRSDPRVAGPARQAIGFLDLIARARPFFAPFVDSASARRAPEYAFVIEPLTAGQPGREMQVGARFVPVDDATHDGVWGFGEAVKVGSSGAAARPFASTGWWGLVEFAMLQKDIKVRIYHPDTMVELPIPTFPTIAPDIPLARR